jgi:hypothetical protein
VVDAVNKLYPGRAAMSAHLDLLITLLSWGAAEWKKVRRTGVVCVNDRRAEEAASVFCWR